MNDLTPFQDLSLIEAALRTLELLSPFITSIGLVAVVIGIALGMSGLVRSAIASVVVTAVVPTLLSAMYISNAEIATSGRSYHINEQDEESIIIEESVSLNKQKEKALIQSTERTANELALAIRESQGVAIPASDDADTDGFESFDRFNDEPVSSAGMLSEENIVVGMKLISSEETTYTVSRLDNRFVHATNEYGESTVISINELPRYRLLH